MKPTLWTDALKWAPEYLIDADSYMAWLAETFPRLPEFTPTPVEKAMRDASIGVQLPGGKRVAVVTLPSESLRHGPFGGGPLRMSRNSLSIFQGDKSGEVYFTGDVSIPAIYEKSKVWMSLTPMEIMSLRPGVSHARGTVLIGGLGMGWFAEQCLKRKQVKHVTVVDLDPGILEYFGAPLKAKYGERLTLVQGDIYDQDAFAFDSYLSDIWPSNGGASYDKKFIDIAAQHPNAWAWGKWWRSEVEKARFKLSRARKAA